MTAPTPREVLDEFGPMTFGPGCEPFNHPIGCQCPYPMAQAERDRLAALTRREPLDVERLAMAIHRTYPALREFRVCQHDDYASVGGECRYDAQHIAAEYNRLEAADKP